MFEVFDSITGETYGYTDTEWEAWQGIKDRHHLDFVCAEHNCTQCLCFGANRWSAEKGN